MMGEIGAIVFIGAIGVIVDIGVIGAIGGFWSECYQVESSVVIHRATPRIEPPSASSTSKSIWGS